MGMEEIDVRVDRYLDRGRRVWYLRCRHWDADPLDLALKALEREGVTVEEQAFPGVRLFLFNGMTQDDQQDR